MTIPRLTSEETSDALHWLGLVSGALIVLNVLVHSWLGKPWDPSMALLGLVASFIAGGVTNERLNPPPATPSAEQKPDSDGTAG